VYAHVFLERLGLRVAFVAHAALVRLYTKVYAFMLLEVVAACKRLAAVLAYEWAFTCEQKMAEY